MLDPTDLPLHGVRVLDFSQFLAGPVAALRLADLGADVTKVERPVTGEIGRTLAFAGRWSDGDTLSFHAMNRNKRAVVADLKDPGDLALVTELVCRADVLVQNFRPGVMARLGLDHETVRRLNPGLVYVSATGYGEHGPWARRPGQDLLAQSVSALPWVGGGDRPVTVGLALADHLMSCHIAQGVTALLVRKARTGRGGLVETSLLEAMLDLQVQRLTARLSADAEGLPEPRTAPAGLLRARDGYVAVAGLPLAELAARLGLPGACGAGTTDAALVRDDDLAPVRAAVETLTADRCVELLSGGDGGWCVPVLALEQLLEHEAFTALGMTQEVVRPPRPEGGAPVRVTTTRSPIRIDGHRLLSATAAPRLGQHGHVSDELDGGAPGAPLG